MIPKCFMYTQSEFLFDCRNSTEAAIKGCPGKWVFSEFQKNMTSSLHSRRNL